MRDQPDLADTKATGDQEIASVVILIADAFDDTVRLAAPQASEEEIEILLRHFVMGLLRRLEEARGSSR
jgi:hypothetical protein